MALGMRRPDMGSTTNKTSKAKSESLVRQKQALELRRMGMDYRDIAAAIGVSKSQAHRLVTHALAEVRDEIASETGALRAEELSRLNRMLEGLWAKARRGDVYAVDRVLKISERRAKLLGLDAPVKLAHGGDKDAPPIKHEDVTSLSDAELERIIAAHSNP